MKKIIIISTVIFSGFSFAQIGVNTTEPKATFDITAKNITGSSSFTDGLLVPRVDRQKAQSMAEVVTSTLIYVNNISTGSLAGKAVNIDSIGFYYFDGKVWVKLNKKSILPINSNIYNADGTLSSNRTIAQENKTLAFTGNTNNTFSIDSSTFSVDAVNHRVGIGTTNPSNVFVIKGTNAQPTSASATLRVDGSSNHALDFGTFDNQPWGAYISSLDKGTGKALPLVLNPLGANVGIATSNPSSSAILELYATDKGFLPPRMTTAQRDALSPKTAGLMIFNTTTKCMENWDSNKWISKCATPIAFVLNCSGASNTGTLTSGTPASGVSTSVPYTGGNGSAYSAQNINSSGVNGLTATLNAGNFANGSGTLTFTITGTPSASGTASFTFTINGQTCTFTRNVVAGISFALNCSSASNSGTLTSGTPASGVSTSVPYTGGNGSAYSAQNINSSGVNGLTATLNAGNFANGNGNLVFTITGTPSASGTASFTFTINGQTCTFTRKVAAGAGSILDLNCSAATHTGTVVNNVPTIGTTYTVPYTGGNGGSYPAQSYNSTGVTGLTATLSAGNFAIGNGNLVFTITGTPSGFGTASFTINIGGQSCTLTVTVAEYELYTCTRPGYFPVKDPTRYVYCTPQTLFPVYFKCQPGTIYNATTTHCQYP